MSCLGMKVLRVRRKLRSYFSDYSEASSANVFRVRFVEETKSYCNHIEINGGSERQNFCRMFRKFDEIDRSVGRALQVL